MKKINISVLISLLIFVVGQLFNSGCSESTNPDDDKFVFPDSNVSFIEDIEPLFQVRCGFESGCHSPTDINNKLLYNDLVNLNGLINHRIRNGDLLVDLTIHQKNPHLAPLYLILKEGFPDIVNDQMPPPMLNRQPLSENQVEGIRQWIREGAKD